MKNISTLILAVLALGSHAQQAKLTSASLGKIEARQIGPAVMGGRMTSIDGVSSDPRIIYIGAAGGGVWKSTNGGASFKAVFEKHCQSIGAIAIDQQRPDVVWVGTGESNMRNTVSIGNGIYKSIDGGDNWVNMGLEKTEHISKVIVNPKNSDIVYASAPGALYSNSLDRGLYKTTDGGKTWRNIMAAYINDSTGCADVVMNPQNPDILYASTWTFRRRPYSFNSGSTLAGIYKSTDGGNTWQRTMNGIAADTLGRMALAIAPSAPDNLVAIVEGRKTRLYISADGATSWKEQSADNNVTARPFYFACIAIDPVDPKRVYRPAFTFSISKDGGYSWTSAQMSSGWVHSDMHGFWINPQNTSQMYVCTDGGLYMSVDRGNNWLQLNNIPVSQLYHVQVDQQEPYNIYGGLQDNGSWMAPSQVRGGIKNGDWVDVGYGDGFWVQPDRTDNKIIYSEYQGGHIARWEMHTNVVQDIQPQPMPGEEKLRFNWNTPIYISPTDAKKLYIGAQYLYRSVNKGISWDRISPDLTTNDSLKKKQEESGGLTADNSSAENHCTIFTIAESPLDANMIYAGTDDGNFQVSRDNAKSWTNYSKNIAASGIARQAWVSSIEPSRFDKNVVYATFDNHMYGDMNTYIGKSTDGGATWHMFKSDIFKGYAHKIKEDIVNPKLLFAGTEMGLYLSIDGGENWINFKSNVPAMCPVRDIVIEPRTNDLLLATHGRGVIVVDDISPLRMIDAKLLNSGAAFIPGSSGEISSGHYGGAYETAGSFVANNPTEEAVILYYLKDRVNKGNVKVAIYDEKGVLVTEKTGTKRKGINRMTWDMRGKPPRVAEGGAQADFSGTYGPLVRPGTYTMKLNVGGKTETEGTIKLIEDKKSNVSKEDREMAYQTIGKVFKMEEELAIIMDSVMARLKPISDEIKKNPKPAPAVKEYYDSLQSVRATLVAVKEGTAITGEEKVREKLSELYGNTASYEGRPTDSQSDRIKGLQKEMEDAKVRYDKNVKALAPAAAKAVKPIKENPY